MTSLELIETLGITKGRKTIKFQEPIVFSRGIKYMPEIQFTITSAEVIRENDWDNIILRGTCQSSHSTRKECALNWYQLKAPVKHLFGKAILKAGLDA